MYCYWLCSELRFCWFGLSVVDRHRIAVETGNPGSAGGLVTRLTVRGSLWHPGSLWGHMLPYDCMILFARTSTGVRNWVRPSTRFLLGVCFTRFSFRGDLWSTRFPLVPHITHPPPPVTGLHCLLFVVWMVHVENGSVGLGSRCWIDIPVDGLLPSSVWGHGGWLFCWPRCLLWD